MRYARLNITRPGRVVKCVFAFAEQAYQSHITLGKKGTGYFFGQSPPAPLDIFLDNEKVACPLFPPTGQVP
jgi:hypothetical protein